MFAAFLYSARLYVTLSLQSLRRRQSLGRLTARGRLLRILLLLAFLPVWLLHWLCLFLDEVLFFAYRKVKIERPLFILGVPRSGTTFLHRTLSEDHQRFTSVSTWEVFFAPAIIQKKFWLGVAALDRLIGRPGARLLKILEKKLFKGMEGVHDMSLEAAEEDYLLLLPLFSCFILFLPFTESRHIWRLARFDWDASEKDKRIIMNFYSACLKKHMYVFGKDKRYLSKNAAFASWPRTLHACFPDADFIICMREPDQAVPSLLGSLESGARFFELDLQQGELPEMLLEMMENYYHHLLENFPKRAPIIHMDHLKRDVSNIVMSLYEEFDVTLDDNYARRLRILAEQAKHYRPRNSAIEVSNPAKPDFYENRFAGYYNRLSDVAAGIGFSSGQSSG